MKLATFHATCNAIEPIGEAFSAIAPQASVLNYVDEGILRLASDLEASFERLQNWCHLARKDGAEALLMTCSCFSPLAKRLSEKLGFPILSIDDAMLEMALSIASSIVVYATLEKAAATTQDQLTNLAKDRDSSLRIETKTIQHAFELLARGDQLQHDELIRETVKDGPKNCDAIVFAQASMARAARDFFVPNIPILTSPEYAVRRLVSILEPTPSPSSV